MQPTLTITLVDDTRVVVPDTLDLITPYVLQEQQDWFEDEIKFLRHLLQPGQLVIDIGANFGVYALSMARTVGPTGRVWAFEPASSTADLLAAGIAANSFTHVNLVRSALSSAVGSALLALQGSPELNSLVRDAKATDATETVTVTTLDACLASLDWRDIEFVKIDAEGEETAILKGGSRFFAQQSPLVQYEVKAGSELHLGLIDAFIELGYGSYRLVPGLDLLVPLNAGEPVDGFLLNLFCCKPDRAAQLAAAGLLVDADASNPAGMRNWFDSLTQLPYAARLAAKWKQTLASGRSGDVEEALSLHAASHDPSRPAEERFASLKAALTCLRNLCERKPSPTRLSSLARVAAEYGARQEAVMALARLNESLHQRSGAMNDEPFLAPSLRFDRVKPRGAMIGWLQAGVLEEFERANHYSSFYTGMAAKPRLDIIRELGYGSEEMQRRRSLLQRRFGRPQPSR